MDEAQIVKMVLDFIEKTGTIIVKTGFPIAVRYAISDGITKIVVNVPIVTTMLIAGKVSTNLFRQLDKNKNFGESNVYSFKLTVSLALFVIATLIFIFWGFWNLMNGIRILLAPEWFAITNIINLVK